MSLLEIRRISKSFGGVMALQGVDFTVAEGEIVGIMGANGAGKTTLFAVIAGHIRPSDGEILFDGKRLDRGSADRINRAGIARTFQIVKPFRGLSALENVATAALFGARPAAGWDEAEARAANILELIGLSGQAGRPAAALTLSAQKKLEVARALATRPKLLLLDEVMAGLIPSEVRAMLEVVRAVKDRFGLTVLIVEHVMQALMALSQRIIVLHHGAQIAEGSAAEVAANAAVQAAYLGESG